jgi:hypothetical protein
VQEVFRRGARDFPRPAGGSEPVQYNRLSVLEVGRMVMAPAASTRGRIPMRRSVDPAVAILLSPGTGFCQGVDAETGIEVSVDQMGFEGRVPAPHLLLHVSVHLKGVPGHAVLTGLDCTVAVGTGDDAIVVGTGALAMGCTLYASTPSDQERDSAYFHVPVPMGVLHRIERDRQEGVELLVAFRPHLRLTEDLLRGGPLFGAPRIKLPIHRDMWLEGLDAWGYESTWVLEVPAARLELAPEVRAPLERAVQLLRDGRADNAVLAVERVRLAMDASGLKKRLRALTDQVQVANLQDHDRLRLERLELLRGALWHCACIAPHDGPDFQSWTRREAEMMVRALTTLLAGM